MPQIVCPRCAELTDNEYGRCERCHQRIGVLNWSVFRFVRWGGRLGALAAMLMVGWFCAADFLSIGLRAKRSEAPSNLEVIRKAEAAYLREWDTYLALPYCPAQPPSRSPVEFDGACAEAYGQLGWVPDGRTRCRYWVELVNRDPGGSPDYIAWAECDVDGDGEPCVYRGSSATKVRMLTPGSVQ